MLKARAWWLIHHLPDVLAEKPAARVMEFLGHSEMAMTMDTYSHVISELQRDAAAKMQLVIFGPPKVGRER
jgi:integrase